MIRKDPSADPAKCLTSSKKGPHDVHAAAKLVRAKRVVFRHELSPWNHDMSF